MKIWILEPKEDDQTWDPWYDKAFGFIVRASTEEEARQFAANMKGDEGSAVWLDDEITNCSILTGDSGAAGVVLRDFASA